jgi:hypothetical protein
MCQKNVPQEVRDVISEFVAQGKVFSNYDVVAEARTRTNSNVRRDEVREEITHQLLSGQMETYSNALVDLDKGDTVVRALVNFPAGSSPDDHPLVVAVVNVDDEDEDEDEDEEEDDDGSSFSIVAVVDEEEDEEEDEEDEEDSNISLKRKTTSEGRINIPLSILKNAVPSFAGSYEIMVNSNPISLVCSNRSGRVRVSLKRFGIKPKDTVTVSNEGVSIRIRS